jgi:pheromone shutdown-related protein TraB
MRCAIKRFCYLKTFLENKDMANVVIVPTSHIAEESIRTVEKVIREEGPDCVAVELDLNRFIVLETGEASNWEALKQLGPWTFLMFFVLKKVQSWLGRKVGIMPGSEMLRAVRIAERGGLHVEFIDRDIGLTLDRLRRVSWREKAKLLLFLFKGLTIDSLLARAGFGKTVKIDLKKLPPSELIHQVMGIFKKEFPAMYRALVSERDAYMARRIVELLRTYHKIVVVVGAAHAIGIKKRLNIKSRGSSKPP